MAELVSCWARSEKENAGSKGLSMDCFLIKKGGRGEAFVKKVLSHTVTARPL
ncbi:hypothetical protein D3C85_447080 [compost metagenome]